jgi:DNA-directed RNA polymerase specialized sigma24 family protein
VFVLSHVEGRTSREVSALTGLNESTVRVHLFRAIRKLRTLLSGDNADSASGELKGKRRVTS